MNIVDRLKKEINATLEQEKQTYSDGAETDDVIQGWIEALEYVNGQIDSLEELEQEQPKDFRPITWSEQMKLGLIADCYLWNNYPKTTNGAYSTSKVTDVVEGILSVIVKFGQQDDCHNETYSEHIKVDRAKLNAWDGKGDFKHIIKGQE